MGAQKIEDFIDNSFPLPCSVQASLRGKRNHDFYKVYYFSIFSLPILIPPYTITGKSKSHSINKDHARISVPSAQLAFSRSQII